jgi:hypothetical protein
MMKVAWPSMTLAALVLTKLSCVGGFFTRKGGSVGQQHAVHSWKHEPFDYSSRIGWDDFYIKNYNASSTVVTEGSGSNDDTASYEWHSHITHSTIIDTIRPAIMMAKCHYNSQQSTIIHRRRLPSILLIGCGNSALPQELHNAFNNNKQEEVRFDGGGVRVTCLDYSPVCINMMKATYTKDNYPYLDFVLGDATKIHDVIWTSNVDVAGDNENSSMAVDDDSRTEKQQFDIIIDKGLLDALMCGDGFDIQQFMTGINDTLILNNWGMHILICFPLSESLKHQILTNESSLIWNFDIPIDGHENGRATFNLARRRVHL